ncbi:hypothetical protein RFI_01367 [Reticulomyxa filosa]|uniref:Uncharacterized protein n=1 Tax=Reticulomyxa filosa TaxID=46433 RepID=X6PBZ1_RETFI|nr:hypothetical protein RFI_01367 [Reticulomyxa filosa]|eukprot:ETO35696.1 hypothetical protein RFI_01367 [Reticulomyxa filosa]
MFVTQYIFCCKYLACVDSTGADIYLNNMTVRQAIHIPSTLTVQWSICSDILNYTTLYDTMEQVYKNIFALDSTVYAFVYNGDTDLACNFLGDEWFVDDLQGVDGDDNYRTWMLDNQIAGWTKDYAKISFVTVRGAGHMFRIYFLPFCFVTQINYHQI